jgi:hypothetical protein
MSIGMARVGSKLSYSVEDFIRTARSGKLTRSRLRSVLGRNNRATLVLAALLAYAVGKLLFAAVWAVGDAYGRQEVVATAFCGALLRVPALWIRHGKPSSSLTSQHEAVRPKSLVFSNLRLLNLEHPSL